jgi:hypothetical protein
LAYIIALVAKAAFILGWRRALAAANQLSAAGFEMNTGVVGITGITAFLIKGILFDFLGNSGSILF